MEKLSLSVIMITLNEEFHLKEAINNVKDWAEDIFIVDSLSSDKTIDIALSENVKIVQRPFKNFGDQWNFALSSLPIKTDWTLKLDPDERLTHDLKEQITQVVKSNNSFSAYQFPRRLWFMGKPLHVYGNVVRLWKTGTCTFSNVLVNEHPIIEGQIGTLKGIMEHYDSRDLHHWIEKQNKYTSFLAIQNNQNIKLSAIPKLFGNKLERRMFFIRVFFKLPCRYFIQLIYELFILGAIIDGYHGIKYVKARIMVRKWRELKIKEIKITNRLPYIPRNNNKQFDTRIINSELQKQILGQ